MQSITSIGIKLYLRFHRRLPGRKKLDLNKQRDRLENFTKIFKVPEQIQMKADYIRNIAIERLIPNDASDQAVLMYLHGGAYCAGSLDTHRAFLGKLASASKLRIIHVDYRLAPEHPYPAALDDAFFVYQHLSVTESGKKIFVAGDSAGGGLALALALKLRDQKQTAPAGLALLAPWVDLVCENETYRTVGRKDLMLDQCRLKMNARMYAGKMDIKHPYISPVYGDLAKLPPTLIMVGTHDMLLGEARNLSEKMKKVGNDVQLQVWPKMMHGWQNLGNFVPEARRSIRVVSDFFHSFLN